MKKIFLSVMVLNILCMFIVAGAGSSSIAVVPQNPSETADGGATDTDDWGQGSLSPTAPDDLQAYDPSGATDADDWGQGA